MFKIWKNQQHFPCLISSLLICNMCNAGDAIGGAHVITCCQSEAVMHWSHHTQWRWQPRKTCPAERDFNKRVENQLWSQDNGAGSSYRAQDNGAVSGYRGQDNGAVSEYRGQDTSAVSSYRGQDTSAVSGYRGQDTSAISSYRGQDTSAVSSYRGQDNSAVSSYRGQGISAVNGNMG